jgi:hypothetical protein
MFSGFCCFIYSIAMGDFGESEHIEPVEIPVDGALDLYTLDNKFSKGGHYGRY